MCSQDRDISGDGIAPQIASKWLCLSDAMMYGTRGQYLAYLTGLYLESRRNTPDCKASSWQHELNTHCTPKFAVLFLFLTLPR